MPNCEEISEVFGGWLLLRPYRKSPDSIESVKLQPLRHVNDCAFLCEDRHFIQECGQGAIDLPLDVGERANLV